MEKSENFDFFIDKNQKNEKNRRCSQNQSIKFL